MVSGKMKKDSCSFRALANSEITFILIFIFNENNSTDLKNTVMNTIFYGHEQKKDWYRQQNTVVRWFER